MYAKVVKATLTREEIKTWVKTQRIAENLTDEEADHVAMCLHHIVQWYNGERPYGLGHFLTAVVKNDFMEACGRADGTNRRVLPIYATFLYNYVPRDWRTKAKERFGERDRGMYKFDKALADLTVLSLISKETQEEARKIVKRKLGFATLEEMIEQVATQRGITLEEAKQVISMNRTLLKLAFIIA